MCIKLAFLADVVLRGCPTFLIKMVDFLVGNVRMEEMIVINTVVERARYRALILFIN